MIANYHGSKLYHPLTRKSLFSRKLFTGKCYQLVVFSSFSTGFWWQNIAIIKKTQKIDLGFQSSIWQVLACSAGVLLMQVNIKRNCSFNQPCLILNQSQQWGRGTPPFTVIKIKDGGHNPHLINTEHWLVKITPALQAREVFCCTS